MSPFETPKGCKLVLRSSSGRSTNSSISCSLQDVSTDNSDMDSTTSSSASDGNDSQSKSPILKSSSRFSGSPLQQARRRFPLQQYYSYEVSNNNSNSNNILNILPFFDWICTATAALLLHATGLTYGVWRHRGDGTATELVLAVTGSLCEGVFLLLLLQRLACWTAQPALEYWWRDGKRKNATTPQAAARSNNKFYHRASFACLCHTARTLAPAVTFVIISFIIITSILGDAYFRAESGGLTPEIWVLAAFYMNAREYLTAKFIVADAAAEEHQQPSTSSSSTASSEAAVAAETATATEAAVAGVALVAVEEEKLSDDQMTLYMVLCYFGAIALYLLGQLYLHAKQRRSAMHNDPQQQQRRSSWYSTVDCRNNNLLLAATAATLVSYAVLEAWTPVTHAFLCFAGRWFFVPGGQYKFETSVQPITTPDSTTQPNVIYLVHESLSGSILEKTAGGRKAAPFFHSLLENNDDFYVFPHARGMSGDTRDCSTALLTGCLPFDEPGREIAYGRSIGTEFKRRGYATMSATSAPMSFDQTAWFMMQNFMGSNMDLVVDPLSTGLPKVNIEACDDHELLPYFDKWVKQDVLQDQPGIPFYGQIYTYNQHYPFLAGANSTGSTRYYSSLESFDSLLKHLFDLLEETGQLDNTIIVGSGDHGEHPDLNDFVRLKRFNSNVINTATYMYAPARLIPSEEDRQRLRHNTERAVSTLDLFPTIQHFLYGGSAEETSNLRQEHRAADTLRDRDHCATGVDLLATRIEDDRLTVQWNKISQMESGKRGNFLGALSGRTTGLYVKGTGGNPTNGAFSAWELDYDRCPEVWYADCAKEMTEERRLHWLKTIQELSQQSQYMISEQMQNTKYMRLLRETLEQQQQQQK